MPNPFKVYTYKPSGEDVVISERPSAAGLPWISVHLVRDGKIEPTPFDAAEKDLKPKKADQTRDFCDMAEHLSRRQITGATALEGGSVLLKAPGPLAALLDGLLPGSTVTITVTTPGKDSPCED